MAIGCYRKITMKSLVCLLTLLSLSLPCQAYWVEATGEAKIINGDSDNAREVAVKNAVRMALLQNGGKFQASQTTNKGQLTDQALTLSAANNISSIQLLNEQKQGNRLTVTVKIDLLHQDQEKCSNDGLKAAILIPRTTIRDRSQLRYGRLEQLPTAFSEHLVNALQQNSALSVPVSLVNQEVNIPALTNSDGGFRAPTLISEMTDSQYLLIPELTDISVAEPTSAILGLWQHAPIRQFQLKLTLYHGISGEIVWQHEYSQPSEWEFAKTAMVNPTSSEFWQSEYGESAEQIITEAVRDIDETLSCRPLLAQIIALNDSQIVLNIGRKNGVKKGDKFKIVLQHNIMDQISKTRAIAVATTVDVEIAQTSESTSTAMLNGESAARSIQVNDIALKN
ncbi:flagella assembly protein FlgT [Shewanella yunxiaonensis]|uniref:Flagella assembly protein FlgT n=2 Tax=Shewanella yunxiaonensis TaxID=2829809 RepID=A0ABX7YVK3_9GAMM|nr:flagella assembly protein FlgT [Shewanella yunxiaonensis]